MSLALLLIPFIAEAGSKSQSDEIFTWMMDNIILVMVALVICVVLFKLWSTMDAYTSYYQEELLREQGIELPKKTAKSKSFWDKLVDKSWNLIPLEKEAEIDLHHDYDGIRELDNSLPPWWLYLFYGTIVWAALYIYNSHMKDGSISQLQEYEIAMAEAEEAKFLYLSRQVNNVNETNVEVVTDANLLSDAKSIFESNCATCHGLAGQGGVGPNLTDDYWVHGGGIKNVFKTIKYGVPEKGMIAWSSQLSPTSMQNISSYILTLRGTNPPDAKKPEGDLYVEESTE